jgi:hypothetical protein
MRERRWRVGVGVLNSLSSDDVCTGEDEWVKGVGVSMRRKERR